MSQIFTLTKLTKNQCIYSQHKTNIIKIYQKTEHFRSEMTAHHVPQTRSRTTLSQYHFNTKRSDPIRYRAMPRSKYHTLYVHTKSPLSSHSWRPGRGRPCHPVIGIKGKVPVGNINWPLSPIRGKRIEAIQ